VTTVTREKAIANLGKRENNRLVAVRQDFEGDITGRALLIFPEAKSMELVRAIVGSELSLEDIMELEQEALAETGNILLNACLATMANNLQRTLKISLPEVLHGEGAEFFDLAPGSDGGDVRMRNIEGYLAMLLDLPSLATLKDLLGALIERTSSQTTIVQPNGS
jgi:chemotaxis protein CheC